MYFMLWFDLEIAVIFGSGACLWREDWLRNTTELAVIVPITLPARIVVVSATNFWWIFFTYF
jgi:hypothetical protein